MEVDQANAPQAQGDHYIHPTDDCGGQGLCRIGQAPSDVRRINPDARANE